MSEIDNAKLIRRRKFFDTLDELTKPFGSNETEPFTDEELALLPNGVFDMFGTADGCPIKAAEQIAEIHKGMAKSIELSGGKASETCH